MHAAAAPAPAAAAAAAAAVHDQGGSAAEFNPASPDGSYSLDLAVAADRVVAVQLVELDRASEKELLRGITLDGKVCAGAVRWHSAPWKALAACSVILWG